MSRGSKRPKADERERILLLVQEHYGDRKALERAKRNHPLADHEQARYWYTAATDGYGENYARIEHLARQHTSEGTATWKFACGLRDGDRYSSYPRRSKSASRERVGERVGMPRWDPSPRVPSDEWDDPLYALLQRRLSKRLGAARH